MTAALGPVIKGTGFFADALRAAAASAITQSIGVATGLQDEFSWAGVAAAGVGGGVGGWAGSKVGGGAGRVAAATAAALANAATRSVIEGTDFGDNVMAALPDVIGQTVGGWVAGEIALGGRSGNPSSRRFIGKSLDQVTDLRLRDAARASGNSRRFMGEASLNSDLRAIFQDEARIIIAARDNGLSLQDAERMIGKTLSGGSAASSSAAGDIVVTGDRTFGDAVAHTLVRAQKVYNGYTEGTRDIVGFGLAVLRGGPVGAIGGFALNKAVTQTLSGTGIDQQLAKVVTLVGSTGLSILSSSPLDVEIETAQSDGREASLIVEAGSTILGIGALGKLRGAVGRGEGGRFGDLKARSAPYDDLTPHHIPQAGRGFTSNADGGAIMMTTGEHALTRTFKARGARTLRDEADLPFRNTLARDIRDVRGIGGSSYNKGLQDVLHYYRKNHPELMKKGQ